MNSIVILCGGNDSGKSSTLKGFFRVGHPRSRMEFVERKLDGKRIVAVGFSSPQELVRAFCKVDRVQKNIEKRIRKCEKACKGQNYILIIPFTMSVSMVDRKTLNENCILKPIEELKKRFNVSIIYLRKTNAQNLATKDALMKKIALVEIETTKDDCDKSAELEKYLRKEVIRVL